MVSGGVERIKGGWVGGYILSIIFIRLFVVEWAGGVWGYVVLWFFSIEFWGMVVY